ncbi:hypothetical protein Zmor_024671 [Zophobas morio]|uniref:Uncharacterized protein n=1 Tax=Zophobas morio TaxID=2755281 RepID=A0AA38M8B1_9CUCU|nr:hypothetical protein Zmor_024671 [Zophobas morio]
MRWTVLLCAVVALATSVFAMQCPTCKGTECALPRVPLKACSVHHPYPLFQTTVARAAATYSCLYVEYYIGEELEQVSQCIVISPGNDVCQALRDKYKVKTCSLKKPQFFSHAYDNHNRFYDNNHSYDYNHSHDNDHFYNNDDHSHDNDNHDHSYNNDDRFLDNDKQSHDNHEILERSDHYFFNNYRPYF